MAVLHQGEQEVVSIRQTQPLWVKGTLEGNVLQRNGALGDELGQAHVDRPIIDEGFKFDRAASGEDVVCQFVNGAVQSGEHFGGWYLLGFAGLRGNQVR